MQPTAEAVGKAGECNQAPEGRKKNVPHVGQHPAPRNLLHTWSPSANQTNFRADLLAYLGGIIREMHGTALIINGTADHVHMLVRIRPSHSAAEIVRVAKANSSRWVHENWARDFAWQTGYGVFSVSESNVAEVTKYIADQEEHHRKHTFQEEFVAFLKKKQRGLRREIYLGLARSKWPGSRQPQNGE